MKYTGTPVDLLKWPNLPLPEAMPKADLFYTTNSWSVHPRGGATPQVSQVPPTHINMIVSVPLFSWNMIKFNLSLNNLWCNHCRPNLLRRGEGRMPCFP